MNQLTRRDFFVAGLAAGIAPIATLALVQAQSRASTRSVEAFFESFTDEWMRLHTDSAARGRYFQGA